MLSNSNYQRRRQHERRTNKMFTTIISIWRFERHEIHGLNIRNRVSTDALNALLSWVHTDACRSYRITQGEEDNDVMVAALSTHVGDVDAGADLDKHCLRAGVVRQRLEGADASGIE